MNSKIISNATIKKINISKDDAEDYEVRLQEDPSVFRAYIDSLSVNWSGLFSPQVNIVVDMTSLRIRQIVDVHSQSVVFSDKLYEVLSEDQNFLKQKKMEIKNKPEEQERYLRYRDTIPEPLQLHWKLDDMDSDLMFDEMVMIAWYTAIFHAGKSKFYSRASNDAHYKAILTKAYKKYLRVGKHSPDYRSLDEFIERVHQFKRLGI